MSIQQLREQHFLHRANPAVCAANSGRGNRRSSRSADRPRLTVSGTPAGQQPGQAFHPRRGVANRPLIAVHRGHGFGQPGDQPPTDLDVLLMPRISSHTAPHRAVSAKSRTALPPGLFRQRIAMTGPAPPTPLRLPLDKPFVIATCPRCCRTAVAVTPVLSISSETAMNPTREAGRGFGRRRFR